MHLVPLAYMAVFRQASLEPGPSGPELSALPIESTRPARLNGISKKLTQNIKYYGKVSLLILVCMVQKIAVQYHFSFFDSFLQGKSLYFMNRTP